jgi:hypothetical protein
VFPDCKALEQFVLRKAGLGRETVLAVAANQLIAKKYFVACVHYNDGCIGKNNKSVGYPKKHLSSWSYIY